MREYCVVICKFTSNVAIMLEDIIITITICIAVYFFVSFNRKKQRLVAIANQLPGPKALPVVGNALHFLRWNHNVIIIMLSLKSRQYRSLRNVLKTSPYLKNIAEIWKFVLSVNSSFFFYYIASNSRFSSFFL